jgi:murein DD-endopeptidase MepM/ murein hydrolase activator NlpD
MNHPQYAPALTLRLPFSGVWFVAQGGDTPNVNHHMLVRSQWFGVDFARVDGSSGRELARHPATDVEHCYSWAHPVLSPLAGVVVATESDLPDNGLGTVDTTHPAGNFVEIRSGAGLCVFLAHFKRGSVRVKAGDQVLPGQVLGLCGNSGNSTMPHVHIHVQTEAGLGQGTGQLVQFEGIDVELSGRRFKNVTWPMLRGLFVRPHEV